MKKAEKWRRKAYNKQRHYSVIRLTKRKRFANLNINKITDKKGFRKQ